MVRVPESVRRDVVQVCKRLYARGLVAGSDGNVSVRVSPRHLLATPTGMSKGDLEAGDLVVCDLTGKQIDGKRRLTTEIKIHLAAYERDDVCAVVPLALTLPDCAVEPVVDADFDPLACPLPVEPGPAVDPGAPPTPMPPEPEKRSSASAEQPAIDVVIRTRKTLAERMSGS